MEEIVTKSNYKDTVFRMLYRDKKELLELYNAVNGTDYKETDELTITTLENAIYMNVKNDVSCMIDMRMNLYEHQSSVNPNLPLRDLFYVSRLYQGLVVEKNLYSSKLIKIPTPKFITFYNGIAKQPEVKIIKLSDAFEIREEEVSLELVTVQLNINPGYNEELKKKCPSLYEYMLYVEQVREYRKTLSINEAVEAAVTKCIKENILADFLRKNRSEVVHMSIFEYDEELHKRLFRQEGYEDGKAEGKAESILELLDEIGEIPEDIRMQILAQKDLAVLSKWLKQAAKAESIEEFVKEIQNN